MYCQIWFWHLGRFAFSMIYSAMWQCEYSHSYFLPHGNWGTIAGQSREGLFPYCLNKIVVSRGPISFCSWKCLKSSQTLINSSSNWKKKLLCWGVSWLLKWPDAGLQLVCFLLLKRYVCISACACIHCFTSKLDRISHANLCQSETSIQSFAVPNQTMSL